MDEEHYAKLVAKVREIDARYKALQAEVAELRRERRRYLYAAFRACDPPHVRTRLARDTGVSMTAISDAYQVESERESEDESVGEIKRRRYLPRIPPQR